MKRNFAKIRDTLGKLVLATATLLWVSCDDNSSNAPVETAANSSSNEPVAATSSSLASSSTDSPVETKYLSVDDFFTQNDIIEDTTGLRGKCISRESYCMTVVEECNYSSWYGYNSVENRVNEYSKNVIDLLLKNGLLTEKARYCLSELEKNFDMMSMMPDYGICPCYDSENAVYDGATSECEVNSEAGKIIDDYYMQYVDRYNAGKMGIVENKIPKLNAEIDSCAHLE